jgi:aminopeptidase N
LSDGHGSVLDEIGEASDLLGDRIPLRGASVTRCCVLVGVLLTCAAPGVRAEERPLHLPIGDPARRDRQVPQVLDGITDAARGAEPQPAETPAAARLRHALQLSLDPKRGRLAVEDVLSVPGPALASGELQFLLHEALTLTSSAPAASEMPPETGAAARFFGINASTEDLYAQGKLKRYRARLPKGGGTLRLSYEGRFDFGLSDEKEQYARGFRETVGIISTEGVYLAGSGFWYPHVSRELFEFELSVAQPAGWHVVAPGNGTSRGADGRARWDSQGPVDEIALAGGPLVVYRESAGAAEALAYLRQKDDALAAKYLEATAQYLELYRGLVGPYPYGKFALVENFWDTGYGMPSYTLLGPQVIRFPFILASSYPHEILHNWWGNSVFVDYPSGNWCEGLTAYMADHLIQEQRGQGEAYRRYTLQKYGSYVKDGRDFPLAGFRSRRSAATEAVGYGKSLMLFHMLRQRLGDDGFRQWSGRFYREYRAKQADFSDIRRSMESVSKQDLARFFTDHVERPGAAVLRVTGATVRTRSGGGYEVAGTLEEAQPGPTFELDVPVVVKTRGAPVSARVRLDAAKTAFTIATEAAPVALHVDPSFDVFRLLDPRETPASLGQIFGEPRILAVLPSAASAAEQAAYRSLVEGWRTDSHQPELKGDRDVRELPKDRALWILGRTNALASRFFSSGDDYTLDGIALTVDRETMPLAGHVGVLVRRHPSSPERAIGFIFADDLAALPGLGRKLPHYGKYSWLGFEGAEPVNVLKGQWTAGDSPLRVDLRPPAERTTSVAALAPPARKALAELPPVFSQKALLEHVAWLAAPEREGRGIGTKGLEAAGDYVAARFEEIGLQPGGDAGTYFQSFTAERSPSGAPVVLRNVIAVLPGSKREWAGQSVVLTAHYDHLGKGWPDVHKGDEGTLHPGADDNASGVAVMLELAKSLAAGEPRWRTLVFVAFSGEEAGLLGSRHYAEHAPFPLDKTIGVVNLDTVGRLFDRKLEVLATGSAAEWPHIFRGAGFVTGVEGRLIAGGLESSDQKSFIDRGVPAVQVFTEPHPDYHRPGDTADKIDGAGLVKVATYVKEAIVYLGERPEPLTNTIATMKGASPTTAGDAGASAAPTSGSGQGRRVSFGTMPDFAFPGPGVRVAGVTQGSPAEKAGLQEGDVILQVDGKDVADLAGFAALLRGLEPGQTVRAMLNRGGSELRRDITVVER